MDVRVQTRMDMDMDNVRVQLVSPRVQFRNLTSWGVRITFMPDFLISLIAVVVILGFMILIHEFGHYAVAKWLGVQGRGVLHRLRKTPARIPQG